MSKHQRFAKRTPELNWKDTAVEVLTDVCELAVLAVSFSFVMKILFSG